MSTNYFWINIPSFFNPMVAKHPVKELEDDLNIFKHIGHRAVAGLYCYKCGILFMKGGTRYAHMSPRYNLLTADTDWRIVDEETEKERIIVCPSCYSAPVSEHIKSCYSFTVTMHRHILLAKELQYCPDKVIVSENGEELTASEFLEMLSKAVIIFQDARIFS